MVNSRRCDTCGLPRDFSESSAFAPFLDDSLLRKSSSSALKGWSSAMHIGSAGSGATPP